jgi:hypothetical protein
VAETTSLLIAKRGQTAKNTQIIHLH